MDKQIELENAKYILKTILQRIIDVRQKYPNADMEYYEKELAKQHRYIAYLTGRENVN